jgi:hypothetical protein
MPMFVICCGWSAICGVCVFGLEPRLNQHCAIIVFVFMLVIDAGAELAQLRVSRGFLRVRVGGLQKPTGTPTRARACL